MRRLRASYCAVPACCQRPRRGTCKSNVQCYGNCAKPIFTALAVHMDAAPNAAVFQKPFLRSAEWRHLRSTKLLCQDRQGI